MTITKLYLQIYSKDQNYNKSESKKKLKNSNEKLLKNYSQFF